MVQSSPLENNYTIVRQIDVSIDDDNTRESNLSVSSHL